MKFFSKLDSPVGPIELVGDGTSLTGLRMKKQRYAAELPPTCERNDAMFREAREQLTAYFKGKLKVFDLSLAPEGTHFQKTVWKALLDIPFGVTESYGALAKRIGHDQGARAVGLANGHNPISIIVPCHRVIGSDGSLTGYGGGLDRKQWLLEHEGVLKKEKAPTQIQMHL